MKVPVRKIIIAAGQTFTDTVSWGQTPWVYRTISAVTLGWPTVVTSVAHGVPDGVTVPVWIANAVGPKINTTADAPWYAQYATDDTLTLLGLNTGRQTSYTANSATLAYVPPKNLTGWSARIQFRRSVTADVLVEAVSTGVDPEVVLTASLGLVATTMTEVQTRALLDGGTGQTTGIAHVELLDAAGLVYRPWDYAWTCTPEGTREV